MHPFPPAPPSTQIFALSYTGIWREGSHAVAEGRAPSAETLKSGSCRSFSGEGARPSPARALLPLLLLRRDDHDLCLGRGSRAAVHQEAHLVGADSRLADLDLEGRAMLAQSVQLAERRALRRLKHALGALRQLDADAGLLGLDVALVDAFELELGDAAGLDVDLLLR